MIGSIQYETYRGWSRMRDSKERLVADQAGGSGFQDARPSDSARWTDADREGAFPRWATAVVPPPTYGGSLNQADTRLVLEFAPPRNDHDPGWPACMGGSPSAAACLLGVVHALAEELNIEIDSPRKGSVYA